MVRSRDELSEQEDKQLKGGVKFIQEIPKLPSGKILRRLQDNNFP